MTELRRRQLLSIIDLTDRLLDVDRACDIGPILLAGLGRLGHADFATWQEVDVRPPIGERVVGWPTDRFTPGFAQRAAPVVHTHPLLALSRSWIDNRRRPPAVGRLSEYVTTRQWRETPLYREALSDVDDQMIMITAVRGPVIRFVSIERSAGTFTERDLELFVCVTRHIRAAIERASASASPALQTSPYAAWTTIDPHWDGARPDIPFERLTSRQQEIVALIADGLTDAQIARRLGISARTVSKQLQRTYAALGVTNRIAALQRLRHPGSHWTRR